MYRFFVKNNQIDGNIITIKNEDVNHIKNVLRFNLKDKIEIVNLDTKKVYICEIQLLDDDYIKCSVIKEKKESNESNIYVHILQGIPKFEKMEWIIEKCTEIGASEFTPIAMRRCIVKLDKNNQEKKLFRWRKIAEAAAKQSKRDLIPIVNSYINFKNIYENLMDYDIVFVAYENEIDYTLKHALNDLKANNKEKYRIAIIIGPEGGITPEEINELSKYNFKVVSLGKRILRTETASMAMVANIIYELEGEDIYGTKEE